MSTRSRSSQSGTGTVKFGTVLSSGATASYPTSFASSPQYNPNSTSGGSKLSGGVIAGIVVACVAFLLLVAFLIVLLVVRRKKASKKSKRLSRTALLPAPATASSEDALQNQPEMMSQRQNYASTAVTVPAATAAPAHVNGKGRLHMVSGSSFSSGHRRTDSNNSTTPFLGTSPDSPSRPSTGNSFEAPRSPTSNRYSIDSTTTYPGSPTAPRHSRFEDVQDGMSRDAY